MRFEIDDFTYDEYMEMLVEKGAIVEEMILGDEVRSPSTQLRITPLGEVEPLSTHDQLLGGPSGQSYLGAVFPADTAYSAQIMAEGIKIGERFAREGIIGRFAVDFIVTKRTDGTWEPFAIEVNLRKGGTTAPYLILQYLTAGDYDHESGVFTTRQGHPKHYVSNDHLESDDYKVFTPFTLFDLMSTHRLHFDPTTQTGVVLHMISSVSEMGRLGITAIGDTLEDAQAIYDRFVKMIDAEADRALQGA